VTSAITLQWLILAISMATAAILKNINPKEQLHMAYDIPARFHNV
jgi:hypothetical protein